MSDQEIRNKLAERKTVHEWLNQAGIPKEENGRPICLLRRLRITVERIGLLERYRQLLSGQQYAQETRETLISLAIESEKDQFRRENPFLGMNLPLRSLSDFPMGKPGND